MFPQSAPFLRDLIATLNARYTYAVLRNYEQLPEIVGARDIDILLDPAQLRAFQAECAPLAERHGYRLVYTTWDTQFWTVVFGRAGDETADLIQLDVQVNLNVLGVIFLDAGEALAQRVSNGKVYHLSPLNTFLTKFVYSTALGTDYPAKYQPLLQEVTQTLAAELETSLASMLGRDRATLAYWQANKGRKLLAQGFVASLRRAPLRQLGASARFIGRHLVNQATQRGLFITFSGPDGCGKTTVIEKVVEAFAMVNPPKQFHFRPRLLPNLGEAAVKLKVKDDVDRRYDMPHRAKNKGALQSSLRLAYYMADYIVGYGLRIAPLRWRKSIVVSDRWFTDVIVDGERSSIFLDYKLICALRRLVPGADYNFLIGVDRAKILQRKQELTGEAIDRIYQRLDYLAARDRSYFWADNNGTPAQAAMQILRTIFDNQHRSISASTPT